MYTFQWCSETINGLFTLNIVIDNCCYNIHFSFLSWYYIIIHLPLIIIVFFTCKHHSRTSCWVTCISKSAMCVLHVCYICNTCVMFWCSTCVELHMCILHIYGLHQQQGRAIICMVLKYVHNIEQQKDVSADYSYTFDNGMFSWFKHRQNLDWLCWTAMYSRENSCTNMFSWVEQCKHRVLLKGGLDWKTMEKWMEKWNGKWKCCIKPILI